MNVFIDIDRFYGACQEREHKHCGRGGRFRGCCRGRERQAGRIVTSFCWSWEWGYHEEFEDLGVHIFWSVRVYPKVDGLRVGGEGKKYGGRECTIRGVLP